MGDRDESVSDESQGSDPPIKPLNRLNVRGILTCGLTSIKTPFAVWMYTCNSPALFSGESSNVRRH